MLFCNKTLVRAPLSLPRPLMKCRRRHFSRNTEKGFLENTELSASPPERFFISRKWNGFSSQAKYFLTSLIALGYPADDFWSHSDYRSTPWTLGERLWIGRTSRGGPSPSPSAVPGRRASGRLRDGWFLRPKKVDLSVVLVDFSPAFGYSTSAVSIRQLCPSRGTLAYHRKTHKRR